MSTGDGRFSHHGGDSKVGSALSALQPSRRKACSLVDPNPRGAGTFCWVPATLPVHGGPACLSLLFSSGRQTQNNITNLAFPLPESNCHLVIELVTAHETVECEPFCRSFGSSAASLCLRGCCLRKSIGFAGAVVQCNANWIGTSSLRVASERLTATRVCVW